MRPCDVLLLIRRGDFRTYVHAPSGVNVEVKLCLTPSVYVHTGYYLTVGQDLPNAMEKRRFSSGKSAAITALKFKLLKVTK